MIKKKIFYDKNTPQARFFMKQNVPEARLIKQNSPQAGFLTESAKFEIAVYTGTRVIAELNTANPI